MMATAGYNKKRAEDIICSLTECSRALEIFIKEIENGILEQKCQDTYYILAVLSLEGLNPFKGLNPSLIVHGTYDSYQAAMDEILRLSNSDARDYYQMAYIFSSRVGKFVGFMTR